MPALRTWILRWGPALSWTLLILAYSSDQGSSEYTSRLILPFLKWLLPGRPPEMYELLHHLIRKVGHITEYGVLSLLWGRALAGPRAAWRARHVAGALAVSALVAVADEAHQFFVPARTPSLSDVALDSAAAVASQTLGWLVRRFRT